MLPLPRFSCLLPLLLSALSQSQTAPPDAAQGIPLFQSKVRVVILDVVVSTAKGEPVSGLKKNDFQVTENGARQTASFFEEHKGEAPLVAKLPPMPPHVYTNFPAIKAPAAVNVLLLDWLNTQPPDQAYVQAQTIEYLKHVAPGTHLAIFTLGKRLRMLQGFTTDVSELVAALSRKSGSAGQVSPLLPTSVERAAEQEMLDLMIMNKAAPAAVEAVKQEMEVSSASDAGKRVALTLEAFQELARYLSGIPGRKNVIWFADSFPIRIFPQGTALREFQGDIRQTADMLTPSQVAIYPVSAEGLATDATYSAEYRQGPPLAEESERRATNQIAMDELATDTGGRAIYNTNGLGDAMAQVVNNGSHYYTLTYTPANKKMDGTYRSIRVTVRGKDYKLSYRRGYYAEDAKAQPVSALPAQADPLLPFMYVGLPDLAQILYKIRVEPMRSHPAADTRDNGNGTDGNGQPTRYKVEFAVSPDDLVFQTTSDGHRQANLEVMLVAYDRDGKPLNLAKDKGELLLSPKAWDDARKSGLQIHREIDVPNVDGYLRTGIYDLSSGKAGTLEIPLTEADRH